MSKRILGVAIWLAAISSIPAYAEDNLGFRVKTGISYVDYTVPGGFLANNTTPVNVELRTRYQASNLGLAYASPEGSFFDFTVRQDTGHATWDSGKGLASLSGWSNVAQKQKAQRTEYTVTVGSAISETVQLFGGYQASNYQVNATVDAMNSATGLPLGTLSFTNYIAMSGIFGGLSKAIRLGNGALNINGSFSLMSALTECQADFVSAGTAIMPNRTTKNYSSGLGYGLGASYTYPINTMFSLVTDLKYHSYKPDKYPKADRSKSLGLNLITSF